ncbi:pilus assembly FimT family protein [Bosea sp. NPDC055332]
MTTADHCISNSDRRPAPLLVERDGFTILEVLVTLALVAITSAGFGIALQSTAQRSALDQGLSTLRQMAALARAEAINSGSATVLTIDLVQSALSIVALSRRMEMPAGTSLRVVTAKEVGQGPQAAIAFFPDGSSSGAEFWLTKGSFSAKAVLGWQNGRFQNAQ